MNYKAIRLKVILQPIDFEKLKVYNYGTRTSFHT